MIFPGAPATMQPSGMSFVTTALAATITLLPICTPDSTATLSPSQTLLPMTISPLDFSSRFNGKISDSQSAVVVVADKYIPAGKQAVADGYFVASCDVAVFAYAAIVSNGYRCVWKLLISIFCPAAEDCMPIDDSGAAN